MDCRGIRNEVRKVDLHREVYMYACVYIHMYVCMYMYKTDDDIPHLHRWALSKPEIMPNAPLNRYAVP